MRGCHSLCSKRVAVCAITIVELVIAASITTILIGASWGFLRLGDRLGVSMSKQSSAAQEVRLRLTRVTRELQEGTRLLWPEPGQTSEQGFGFVNARGETILYVLKNDANASGDKLGLVRVNKTVSEETGKEADEVVVRSMHHLRATTADQVRGRQPSCLQLDVCAGVDDPSAPDGVREVDVITSVFLRSLEKDIPDDRVEIEDGRWYGEAR